ncbi:MAG: PIN domain-containing protein [Bacteroidota bacterium]
MLLDTNVVLDVLLKRQPHAADAAWLFGQVERGHLDGLLGATTLTTIHYVARKTLGDAETRGHVGTLLRLFEVAPVTRAVLEDALALPFGDFEDAVLHEAARHAGAEGVVTRNVADFTRASLSVYTPSELRAALQQDAG